MVSHTSRWTEQNQLHCKVTPSSFDYTSFNLWKYEIKNVQVDTYIQSDWITHTLLQLGICWSDITGPTNHNQRYILENRKILNYRAISTGSAYKLHFWYLSPTLYCCWKCACYSKPHNFQLFTMMMIVIIRLVWCDLVIENIPTQFKLFMLMFAWILILRLIVDDVVVDIDINVDVDTLLMLVMILIITLM